jgi:hypothetical protein
MLLTHDIGQANHSDPVTVTADHVDFLKTANTTSPIQTHQLHTASDIARYTCFFSLRRNPVDTIMSSVLAYHYKLYHVQATQSVDLQPFLFTNWLVIDQQCRRYVNWCTHYSSMLQPDHRVVYYEDYIAQITSKPVYQRTFPEKRHLLNNYQQVLDYILNFNDCLLGSQECFAQQALNLYKD